MVKEQKDTLSLAEPLLAKTLLKRRAKARVIFIGVLDDQIKNN